MEPLYREFGLLLKAKRSQARLTQDEMALRVGLGRTSITNIEQGKQPVSLQLLYRLAEALGAAPHELLPLDPPKASLSEDMERNLSRISLRDDEKDWVRRVVLKTSLESAPNNGNT
jgi:transcriptional regulator with XRE-family HTH domain